MRSMGKERRAAESEDLLGASGIAPDELRETPSEELDTQTRALDDDSGEIKIVSEAQLPLDAAAAQRLAEIQLRRTRQGTRDNLGTPFGAVQMPE